MQILEIIAKVGDRGTYNLFEDGQEIASDRGYVPDFIAGEHYGDSLVFTIDVDTGQILNWRIDKDKLDKWIEENKSE